MTNLEYSLRVYLTKKIQFTKKIIEQFVGYELTVQEHQIKLQVYQEILEQLDLHQEMFE